MTNQIAKATAQTAIITGMTDPTATNTGQTRGGGGGIGARNGSSGEYSSGSGSEGGPDMTGDNARCISDCQFASKIETHAKVNSTL
jgi:hypothetical protein